MGSRITLLAVALIAALQVAAYTPELPPTVIASCGTGCAIDWTKNDYYQVSALTASTTLAFTAPSFPGSVLVLEICQNGSGGNTVTWPGNVLDGGRTPVRADAIYPLQVSACGSVQLTYDGTNYYITGKPDLISNCSGTAALSTGTGAATNLCCDSTSNIFACYDTTDYTKACLATCGGSTNITFKGNASDGVTWERVY